MYIDHAIPWSTYFIYFFCFLLTLFLSRGKMHCMKQWESTEMLLKSKTIKWKPFEKQKGENSCCCKKKNPRLVTLRHLHMFGGNGNMRTTAMLPSHCHNQAVLSSKGQSCNQQNWRRVCDMFTGHSKNTFIYQEMRIELCCVFDKKLPFLFRTWSSANVSSKSIFLLVCRRNCH